MAAIETPNALHAMATLDLSNVADGLLITKSSGVRSAHRVSAGVYTVTLDEPLDVGGGIAFLTNAAGTARIVGAQFQTLASAGEDNLQLNTFTDAGVAADIGAAYLFVFRYPVVA